MRSTRKPLTVLLGIIIFPLILSGVLFLLLWLDTDHEQIKQQLQSRFRQQTGYNLSIAGQLHLQFFPILRISADKVTITDNNQKKLLDVGQLLFELDPGALLQDEIVVDRVVIESMLLQLVRDHEGKINLLTGGSDTDSAATAPTRLPVDNLELRNSEIRITDQKNNKALSVSDLNVSLSSPGNAQYRLQGNTAFKVDEELHGKLELALDIQHGQVITINNIKSLLTASRNQQLLDLGITGELRFSPFGKLIQAIDINLESKDMGLKAGINAEQIKDDLSLSVAISDFMPLPLLNFLDITDQQKIQENILQHISGDLEIVLGTESVAVQVSSLLIDDVQIQGKVELGKELLNLQVKIDEIKLAPYMKFVAATLPVESSGSETQREIISSVQVNRINLDRGHIEQFVNKLQIKPGGFHSTEGGFIASNVNPAALYQLYISQFIPDKDGLLKLDGKDLNYLDGKLGYKITAEQLSLSEIALKLDETAITGDISYLFEKPEINANLSIGKIDTTRYLKLLPATKTDDVDDSNQAGNPVAELITGLKEMQGQGEIAISSLRHQDTYYKGMRIQFNSE